MASDPASIFRRIDDAIRFTDGYAQTVVREFGPEVTRWIESVSAVKKARESAGLKTGKVSKAKARRVSVTESTQEATDTGVERTEDLSPPPNRLRLQGFNAIEFVVPGTRFFLAFHLEENQLRSGGLSLFLHALRDFVLQQDLGGWTKNGFGRFEFVQATIGQSGSGGIEHNVFTASLDKGEFDHDPALVGTSTTD